MEKELLKLQKKVGKIFAIFEKMIERLIGHNESLQQLIDKARDEIQKHQAIVDAASQAIGANQEQIKKIETFIGVGNQAPQQTNTNGEGPDNNGTTTQN